MAPPDRLTSALTNQPTETERQSRQSRIILIGIVIGIAAGLFVGLAFPGVGGELAFLGDIFLALLKMLIIPLVVSSMIMGIATLGDVRRIGKMGGVTVGYYLSTTFIAVMLGIILVNVIGPGRVGTDEQREQARALIGAVKGATLTYHDRTGALPPDDPNAPVTEKAEEGQPAKWNTVALVEELAAEGLVDEDILEGAIEDGQFVDPWGNPVQYRIRSGAVEREEITAADIEVWVTGPAGTLKFEIPEDKAAKIGAQGAYLSTEEQGTGEAAWHFVRDMLQRMIPTNIVASAANLDILPLIVFALLFGGVLTTIGRRGKPVLAFMDGIFHASMKLVHLLMWFAPIGIFALVAARFGAAQMAGGVAQELERLAMYSFTVVTGLLVHAIIILPLLLFLVGRRNPLKYAVGMAKALFTAFSTASSSATLPLTIEGVSEGNKVNRKVTDFVLPLGATVNMDGTALYEAVAAIFIAQLLAATGQIDPLSATDMGIIFVTATLAAIGAAGIPEAGLVTMAIVFTAVGLPLEAIGTILVIDWLLDRCRTTVNVWGDAVGCAVVERVAGIPADEPEDEEEDREAAAKKKADEDQEAELATAAALETSS